MARPSSARMARTPSNSSSALSNILVKSSDTRDNTLDSDLESVQSTPATSHGSSMATPKKNDSLGGIRGNRKRKAVNYNENTMTQDASRNVSGLTGDTLIDDEDRSKKRKTGRDTSAFPDRLPPRSLKPSMTQRVKKAVKSMASNVKDKGKKILTRLEKELDTGKKGIYDKIDWHAISDEDEKVTRQPSKLQKKSTTLVTAPAPASATPRGQKAKVFLDRGLYAGQAVDGDNGNKSMPQPMFGKLDVQKDFKIPFDIFNPSVVKGDPKPKNWTQLNKNKYSQDAKTIKKEEMARVIRDTGGATASCTCRRPAPGQMGCLSGCHNRAMEYECDETNCALEPEQCSNRQIQKFTKRLEQPTAYGIGVEVVMTTDGRGFGCRATRAFAPGELIMEYTGEIITEAECQERMRDVYTDHANYYIMEFCHGLHIDGTKGSMARFINHSCAPNCKANLVAVKLEGRMGIFAGDDGINTGQELTYDYNFINFGESAQPCYCGARDCRGTLCKRLNAAQLKLKAKEDEEKQALARQQAMQQEQIAAKVAGLPKWKGYLNLKDKQAREQLLAERQAKEEAAKNNPRAQRHARRNGESVKPEEPRKLQKKRKHIEEVEETTSRRRLVKNKTIIQIESSKRRCTKGVSEEPEIELNRPVLQDSTKREDSQSQMSIEREESQSQEAEADDQQVPDDRCLSTKSSSRTSSQRPTSSKTKTGRVTKSSRSSTEHSAANIERAYQRSTSTTSAIGNSRFSEDLPRTESVIRQTELSVSASTYEEVTVEEASEVSDDDPDLDIRRWKRSSILGKLDARDAALLAGTGSTKQEKTILKTTKQLVKDTVSKSKAKIMRQSILSFGKV